mmetsp:Transcript_7970/g.16038  ORF Transcript_7970/g.16038 Transcript_7970/m.16038 type:complete len:531 (-) Transcript_7970:39-1631(-)
MLHFLLLLLSLISTSSSLPSPPSDSSVPKEDPITLIDRTCSLSKNECVLGLAVWCSLSPSTFPLLNYTLTVDDTTFTIDVFGDIYNQLSSPHLPFHPKYHIPKVSDIVGNDVNDHIYNAIIDQVETAIPIAAVNNNVLVYAPVGGIGWVVLKIAEPDYCPEIFDRDPRASRLCSESNDLISAAMTAAHDSGSSLFGAAWRPNWESTDVIHSTSLLSTSTSPHSPLCSCDEMFTCLCQPSQSFEGVLPPSINLLGMVIHKSDISTVQPLSIISKASAPSSRGVTLFCPTDETHPLVTHVINAIKFAESSGRISDIKFDGKAMTKKGNRLLLNFLCSSAHPFSPHRYLEVGAYRGSSLVSCLSGNQGALERADSIDSFVAHMDEGETPEVAADFVRNAANAVAEGTPFDLEMRDFRDGEMIVDIGGKSAGSIDVYLFDGPHSRRDHSDAFLRYDSIMSDVFIAIIDDWNLKPVRLGTQDAFKTLGYKVLYQRQVYDYDGTWHSGIGVFVIQRNSEQDVEMLGEDCIFSNGAA